MQAQHYDAVVIGSGQGGNPLARALAEAGRKTAIIERFEAEPVPNRDPRR